MSSYSICVKYMGMTAAVAHLSNGAHFEEPVRLVCEVCGIRKKCGWLKKKRNLFGEFSWKRRGSKTLFIWGIQLEEKGE